MKIKDKNMLIVPPSMPNQCLGVNLYVNTVRGLSSVKGLGFIKILVQLCICNGGANAGMRTCGLDFMGFG